MQLLLGRLRNERGQINAEITDRLVSAILEDGRIPDLEDEGMDPEAHELLHVIRAIRQVGAADSPLPESRVDTIMADLQREVAGVDRSGVWRERLGIVAGFLACTLSLGSGLLLLSGISGVQPSAAGAAPAAALAVASVAALISLVLYRNSQLHPSVLPLLAIGVLASGSSSAQLAYMPTVEVPSTALTVFQEGEELWGVRDIIESGEVIWVLTEAPPFLRAYHRDGHVLADFGTFGRGPGELSNPWTLSAASAAGSVIVWDYGARRRIVFDAAGNFATSISAPITLAMVRNDIRSVTFGDPFRVAEYGTDLWVASYPDGISRADDFWDGTILRVTGGDAEPQVFVDFAVDLVGASDRTPTVGLGPVPVWDRCPDGSIAVLDPVGRSLHLYAPGTSRGQRRILLPWTGQRYSRAEHLAYFQAMVSLELRGSGISDAEIDKAAKDVLLRYGDRMPDAAPIGIDLRCSAERIWIQEFDGSSHPLGYGKGWRTVSWGDTGPLFHRVVFPDGFQPYRMNDSLAIGVVTDSADLQRVALVRLAAEIP